MAAPDFFIGTTAERGTAFSDEQYSTFSKKTNNLKAFGQSK
jgi:hypothetical protein